VGAPAVVVEVALGPDGDLGHGPDRGHRVVTDGLSPESMSALVPSKTALATSLTSAGVGDGARTMDSSIWVAVMTGRP
jgi:hypothetical protein